MTGVAGFVKVPVTAKDAAAIADWCKAFKPGSGASEALDLVARLRIASRYPRKSIQIPREVAAYAVLLADATSVWLRLLGVSPVDGALAALTFGIACRAKLHGPGRRHRTPRQIRKRIDDAARGKIEIDDSELRLLKRLARRDDWLDRVRAAGQTVLTYEGT